MSGKPIKFISTVSRRGDDGYVIAIPKAELDKLVHLWHHRIKVTVEEIPL